MSTDGAALWYKGAMRLVTAALLALLTFAPSGVAGQVPDRSVRWLTIRTPHFEVTYHEPLGLVARRASRILEDAHARLVPLLGHEPREITRVVLTDATDFANGSATSLPYNNLQLFTTAPEDLSSLSDYDDWLTVLIVHEHTHILHLDNISGVPALINAVFGKVYAPNLVQPRWFIEGYATFEESRNTSAGRMRSSVFEMYMRMAVLEDALFPLDQMSTSPDAWPQGNVAYLYGSRFLQFIADHYGEESLARMAEEYGRQVVPYGINRIARRATGRTVAELYDEWKADMTARYGALRGAVLAEGLREGERLTFAGQTARAPRYLDAAHVVYYLDDGRENPAIATLDLSTGEVERLARVAGSGYPAPSPDGRSIWFNSLGITGDVYALNELYRLDLASGVAERVTTAARAREPDLSPDGRRVVFTRNSAGTTHLVIADTADVAGTERVLLRSRRFEQVFTPRFSPDGRTVAISRWRRGGFRDIEIVDVATGAVTPLTHDRAQDTGPCFSPDGRYVLFSSDRTRGISNLYAHDLATGTLHQVTNVVSGAFHPAVSPDGRELVYLGYTSIGWDLYRMPLALAELPVAPPSDVDRPPSVETDAVPAMRSERYRPADTLLPRAWLLELADGAFGRALGITFDGGDVVGFHRYEGRVDVSLTEGYTDAELAWSYNRLRAPLSLRTFRRVSPRGGLRVGGVSRRWIEDAVGIEAAVRYSFPGAFHGESVRLSYGITDLRKAAPFGGTLDPNTPPPVLPQTGRLATLRAGWGYSDARQTHWDTTPSYGRSVSISATLADRSFGSEYRSLSVSWAINRYLENPWVQHHVLALRYAGGMSGGDLGRRGVFSVGGFPDATIQEGLLDDVILGGQALRGYPAYDRSGTQFHLLQAEYRFPIYRPQWGVGTLPFFVNRVYGTVFTDFGDAFFGDLDLDRFRWGVGAEVFVDFTLGFVDGYTLRTGLAYGPNEGGEVQFYSHIGLPF